MLLWRGSIEMTSAATSAKRIDDNNSKNDRSNREGLRGWLNPITYGWERVSYWFQRLTGIFLLVYFIGHVYETSSLVSGPDVLYIQ
jgi:succinate dehydrogenase / fumarate reductase cytochrome b subunit